MRGLILGTGEDGLGQHPQGHAFGRDDPRRMQPKTALFLAFLANRTQPLGLGEMGIIQVSRVLDRQHPPVLAHPFDGPLLMRGLDAFRCRLIIVEKAIGRFGIGPIFTGLVNRTMWLHRQLHRQLAAAVIETSVLQLYFSLSYALRPNICRRRQPRSVWNGTPEKRSFLRMTNPPFIR
jgi:hypothetical protein